VEIDFIAEIKNLEQNVKQQNINKAMTSTNSLNDPLTSRHLFLHSSLSSTNQTMQNIQTQVVTSISYTYFCTVNDSVQNFCCQYRMQNNQTEVRT